MSLYMSNSAHPVLNNTQHQAASQNHPKTLRSGTTRCRRCRRYASSTADLHGSRIPCAALRIPGNPVAQLRRHPPHVCAARELPMHYRSLALRTIYATLSGPSHARKPPLHSYADQPPFLRSYTNQPRPFLRNRQLPLRIHAPLTRTRRTQLLPPAHSRVLHPDPIPHSHPDPPGRHHVGIAICACLLASSRDTTIDDATRSAFSAPHRKPSPSYSDTGLYLYSSNIAKAAQFIIPPVQSTATSTSRLSEYKKWSQSPFRVWTTETSAVTTHTKVKPPKYSSEDSFVFPHAVAEYKKLDDDEGKVLNQRRMYLASLVAFHSIAIYDREIPMQHYGSAA
ncbi:hypothetical protein C8J57DRAFT_1520487 [Mycena rebaudengoi]|nr:hypothetical protein C8J57DRAFT_1520487 [Mycena rebaudengoi]